MEYTIEQLLELDFLGVTNVELDKIIDFINENYFTDTRYVELLEEATQERDERKIQDMTGYYI